MKAMLSQLALIFGGAVALISLVANLLRDMDLLTAVVRAGLVFVATVTVMVVFLRLFSMILVRFVAEQVVQKRTPETKPDDNPRPTARPSMSRPGGPKT
ncbi:MAG TPA: hypothetical protein DCS43_11410 [Verrucomicrobia bacterium]|nr:hypothetical protein [Verrucomicrobiota bacterium]